ncbi:hypothetical protein SAMN05216389_11129 [Oceanobacillus limi]|uniref:Uncharacterized protein n=1 Tax=Oceanobacillus limi TaxID=930131 RepID=A0A1I0ECW9_9BACI|nr:hypothetical protein SAMN05216389_11129 [Oceanobacillus limi]
MKILLIKIVVLLLCIPAYPFYVFFVGAERRRYFGNQTTYKDVSKEYWQDVKETLLYRKEDE